MSKSYKDEVGVWHIFKTSAELIFEGSNLSGADLRYSDLYGADLRGENLSGANLHWAYLRNADLSYADMRNAELSGVELSGANLSGTKLPDLKIKLPELGKSFKAWKKTTKGVIRIEIPADAERTATVIGTKCRASKVKVLWGRGCGGSSPLWDLLYNKGCIVVADTFNDSKVIECTNGIHFFMSKKEAEEWRL